MFLKLRRDANWLDGLSVIYRPLSMPSRREISSIWLPVSAGVPFDLYLSIITGISYFPMVSCKNQNLELFIAITRNMNESSSSQILSVSYNYMRSDLTFDFRLKYHVYPVAACSIVHYWWLIERFIFFGLYTFKSIRITPCGFLFVSYNASHVQRVRSFHCTTPESNRC